MLNLGVCTVSAASNGLLCMNKTAIAVIFGVITWAMLLLIGLHQVYLQYLLRNATSEREARTLAELDRARREATVANQRAADVQRQLQAFQPRIEPLPNRRAT